LSPLVISGVVLDTSTALRSRIVDVLRQLVLAQVDHGHAKAVQLR